MDTTLFLQQAKSIDSQASGHAFYPPREEALRGKNLPFLVTNQAFALTDKQKTTVLQLGQALKELYSVVASAQQHFEPFFFRPDVLVTQNGFKVCEIETQPFGFPLSIFLHQAYASTFGLSTEKVIEKFVTYWQTHTGGKTGIFVYSDHTAKFFGQLQFFTKLLNTYNSDFMVKYVSEITDDDLNLPLYRAFYTFEEKTDPKIADLVHKTSKIFPPIHPYFEGKYLLADSLAQPEFTQQLRSENKAILHDLLIPTWFVGTQPPPHFPMEISKWQELALLSRSQRNFVVKRAGGHPDASWGKSVIFLSKLSKVQVEKLFTTLAEEKEEWVIQPFYENEKVQLDYANEDFSAVKTMQKASLRITPYFDYRTGELLNIKVTARENTLLIHGSSDSINTAVT